MTNLGVVGCGYWGPNLIRNFHLIPDCRVKTVCDFQNDRLLHIQNLYPSVEITSDFDGMIQDPEIDAISIATPVFTHYPLAKKSLEAGKHTLIEKPMASTVSECRDLMEIAERKQLVLMVGHTFIYSPVVNRIKEIIQNGDLGEILYVSSRRLNLGLFQNDINVAWDLAPHDISIILYVLDKSPTAVYCQGKAHINPGVEDMTNMTIDYANGTMATIQSSWLDPNKIREMTVVGSKRMLVYDDLQPLEKIKIYDKRVEVPPHYDTYAEFQCSYHYGDMYSPYVKQTEPLKVECQHFLDCIQEGKRPITSAEEGLQVVQILEAATQSLRTEGNRVDLHLLEPATQI